MEIVLVIHFVGLMMGAGGGFASGMIARVAAKAPPERAGPLRSLGPMLARMSSIGLTLMWLSGGTLVFLQGGLDTLPSLFWVKFLFVLSLTAAAIAIEITYAQIKAGNMKAAARLPVLGPMAGISSLLAVLFAVLAFH